MITTEAAVLVYLPDPFGVREAVFWLRNPDGTGLRLTATEISALKTPFVTVDLAVLTDELRRTDHPVPEHPVDVADALRLLVGQPRDEGGERRWDVWNRLQGFCAVPDTARTFRALFKAQSPWPELDDVLGIMRSIADALARLWMATAHDLHKLGEWHRFASIEAPVQAIFAARQYAGIAVDQGEAERLLRNLTDEKYKAYVAVAEAIGASPTGLNFWTIAPYLSRTDAADLGGETDGGNLRDAFRLAAGRSSFANAFLRLVEAGQDEAIIRRTSGFEDRLHPTFSVLGTVSGRILVSDPYLQQLRRRYRGVVAADAGKRLIYLDYAQFEPGVLAFLSADAELLEAYNEGDLYTKLAEAVFGDPEARPLAKRMFLAFSYGMSAASVARLITAPNDVGLRTSRAAIVAGFFDAFPGLAAYKRRMERVLEEQGFVSTLEGNLRRRTGTGELSAKERRWAVNQPIQGTAALIFKEALVSLAETFGRDAILLPVHDAVLMQFNEDENFDTAVKTAKLAMCEAFKRRCPTVRSRVTAGVFA